MKRNLVFCIVLLLFIDSTRSASVTEIQRKLNNTIQRLFASFYPNLCAQVILNSTVTNQYVSTSLIGRISPFGSLPVAVGAVEYLYGFLCNIPNISPQPIVLRNLTVLAIAFSPNSYQVFVKLLYTISTSQKFVVVEGFSFDQQFKLCGYEGVVRNPGLTFDPPVSQQPSIINSLCQQIQQRCAPGSPYQQYANVSDCVWFLSTQVPFGSYDRADQGNVACRTVHIRLAKLRPDIHCPHVGKAGGGACVNRTPESFLDPPNNFLDCAYKFA